MPFPNKEHQWKPGQSGNPGGRPKGRSLTSRIRDLLDTNEIDGKPIEDGKQVADLVVDVIIERALRGDFKFVDLVMNRIDGKLPDTVVVDSNGTTDTIRDFLLGKNEPPETTEDAS
jgi:Family of unknown function (DUF5681)